MPGARPAAWPPSPPIVTATLALWFAARLPPAGDTVAQGARVEAEKLSVPVPTLLSV